MTLTETINVVALWLSTIVFAGSAVAGLVMALRRNRDELMNRASLWALPTTMLGASVALLILIAPRLVSFATKAGGAADRSPLEQASTIWVFVTVVVLLVWLVALVFACVAIEAYQGQRRPAGEHDA